MFENIIVMFDNTFYFIVHSNIFSIYIYISYKSGKDGKLKIQNDEWNGEVVVLVKVTVITDSVYFDIVRIYKKSLISS